MNGFFLISWQSLSHWNNDNFRNLDIWFCRLFWIHFNAMASWLKAPTGFYQLKLTQLSPLPCVSLSRDICGFHHSRSINYQRSWPWNRPAPIQSMQTTEGRPFAERSEKKIRNRGQELETLIGRRNIAAYSPIPIINVSIESIVTTFFFSHFPNQFNSKSFCFENKRRHQILLAVKNDQQLKK